jgi:putative component of toxin-antitoxin plasmid stabilization module
MDDTFQQLTDDLHEKYRSLMAMEPLTVDAVPRESPKGGVYLFSEHADHLYAGRTKRRIRDRVKDHVGTANDCPFAWRLAREATGKNATYAKKGSRADLLKDPTFKAQYDSAKKRIRTMQVRYVGEPDPVRQALLEIYVAVVSGARHNDFDTH